MVAEVAAAAAASASFDPTTTFGRVKKKRMRLNTPERP